MLDKNFVKIEKITAVSFRPFGRIIEYPKKHLKGNKRNLWRIILTDPNALGWRIAYLVLRDRRIHRLERHRDTYESFEPIAGKCLIYLSQYPQKGDIKCFLLDCPIILNKGIWHGLVTLDQECEIKITENAKLMCEYFKI